LAAAGLVALWVSQQGKAPSRTPTRAHEPDIAVPYEFIWAEGATRGVDIPREILIPSLGKRVPIRSIGDIESEPGEEKICGNGSGFSVRMTSNGAVTTCAVAPVCMEGHASLGQSIHSHCPGRPNLRPTLVDEIMSGGRLRKGRSRSFGRCDTDAFSSTDFAARRPGWLAGVRALHWQDGPDKVKTFRPAP
jgi:hypothetical protein